MNDKGINNNIGYSLKLVDFNKDEDLSFIHRILTSSDSKKLWSPKSEFIIEKNRLEKRLINDWGDFIIYIGSRNGVFEYVFAMYNISLNNSRGNIMVWIDKGLRSSLFTFEYHLLSMKIANDSGISRVFGYVNILNSNVVKFSEKFGYDCCGRLPDYFFTTNGFIDVEIISRKTKLNIFEERFINLKNRRFNYE